MTLLLAVIYAAFISLGLPDAVVGAAWPSMTPDLGADPAAAGLVSMTVSASTILASFASGFLLRTLGTWKVSVASIGLTAIALLGYSAVPNFGWLIALSIPLGLGGGAIDTALNAYVALHFSANHMNWLHASWGIGASTGPLIVGWYLNVFDEWRPAYITIAVLQFGLMALVWSSRKHWPPETVEAEQSDDDAAASRVHVPFYRLPNIWPILASFFLYTGLELTTGLWSATFLVRHHHMDEDMAAAGAAAFYIGITGGRILAGFLTKKLSNPQLLRTGSFIVVLGAATVLVIAHPWAALVGFVLVGVGCAPVYPAMLKETARRFGAENTQRIMGLQMGLAYTGSLTVPPLVGLLVTRVGPLTLPIVVLVMATIMWAFNERVEGTLAAR